MHENCMKETIHLSNGKKIRVSWWQVALLALALSAISRLMATKSSKKSQKFYSNDLKQAPWAPPGWLFGPAWTINNFFLLRALLKIVQMKSGPAKNKLIFMQLFIWSIFYSFDYVYFKKRSPILAALWTKTDSVLALVSLAKAWKLDREIAYCYLPLSVWTVYAGTVADYQLLNNADPVFNTRPLLNYL
jgi:benzodiazapine receptor